VHVMTCNYLYEQLRPEHASREASNPRSGGRRGARGRILPAVLLPLLLVAAGCNESSPTDPPADPPRFQGALDPAEGFSEVEGTVSLVLVAGEGFTIEVEIEGAPEAEGGLPWMLREGSCAEPGDPLGDFEEFPPVELDEEGAWSAEVEVPLSATLEAVVFDLRRSADELEVRVACAVLEPEED
jgi:hypothetical protein